MENKLPKTLEELKKIVPPVRKLSIKQRENLSRLDKLAVWITQNVGSMGFSY